MNMPTGKRCSLGLIICCAFLLLADYYYLNTMDIPGRLRQIVTIRVFSGACKDGKMVFSELKIQSANTWREVTNDTYVFTAYYDATHNRTFVKIIGLANPNTSLFCHVWDNKGETSTRGKATLEVPIGRFQ